MRREPPAAAVPATPGSSATLPSLWRNRDYALFIGGRTVSLLGSQTSQIAFPLLVLALTHSPAQAGLTGAIRMIPYLILTLPAGAMSDRWNRKHAMILCDSARALALGSMVISFLVGHVSLLQIYIVTGMEGALAVFFNMSGVPFIRYLVPIERLPDATGQLEAAGQTASLLGSPLGGALFGVAHALPFLTDALSYIASVISLRRITVHTAEERPSQERNLQREIGEGIVWLWRHPLVRTLAILAALVWIVISPESLLVIVLAKRAGASPAVIGIILGAGGVGGLLGALLAPRLQRRFTFAQVVIVYPVLLCGLWLPFAADPTMLVLAVIHCAIFLTFPTYNIVQYSYRLAIIPETLQGRVNSVFRLVAFAGQPVGLALGGFLMQWAGTRNAVLLLLAAPVLMAVLAAVNPAIRRAPALSEVAI